MVSIYSGAEPSSLIPGNPLEVEELAGRLDAIAYGLGSATAEIDAISAGQWTGLASDAFVRIVRFQPERFDAARSAFASASAALREFAEALTQAQSRAADAIAVWNQAQATSHQWAQNEQQGLTPAVPHDPGAAGRGAANAMLHGTVSSLESQASRTRAILEDAYSGAPKRPGFFSRALDVIESVAGTILKWDLKADWNIVTLNPHFYDQLAKGFWHGTVGVVVVVAKGADTLENMGNPEIYATRLFFADPAGWRNIPREVLDHDYLHPAHTAYVTADWIVHHKAAFAKEVVDWKNLEHDPGYWIGEMLPTVLLTAATAGGGAVAKGADAVDVAGDASKVAEGSADAVKGADAASDAADVSRNFESAMRALGNGDTAAFEHSMGDVAQSTKDALGDVSNQVLTDVKSSPAAAEAFAKNPAGFIQKYVVEHYTAPIGKSVDIVKSLPLDDLSPQLREVQLYDAGQTLWKAMSGMTPAQVQSLLKGVNAAYSPASTVQTLSNVGPG